MELGRGEKLKLWFFRDLSDDQRLKLFSLFGMPVDEIGKVHGRQLIALRHVFRELRGQSRIAPSPALEANQQVIETLREQLHRATDVAFEAMEQVETMRAALEPFAEAAEDLDEGHPDNSPIWEVPAAMSIDAKHLRAAHAAITPPTRDEA